MVFIPSRSRMLKSGCPLLNQNSESRGAEEFRRDRPTSTGIYEISEAMHLSDRKLPPQLNNQRAITNPPPKQRKLSRARAPLEYVYL